MGSNALYSVKKVNSSLQQRHENILYIHKIYIFLQELPLTVTSIKQSQEKWSCRKLVPRSYLVHLSFLIPLARAQFMPLSKGRWKNEVITCPERRKMCFFEHLANLFFWGIFQFFLHIECTQSHLSSAYSQVQNFQISIRSRYESSWFCNLCT